MSRGGRGGGSTNSVRLVANVLGLQQKELSQFTQIYKEPPPLYPVSVAFYLICILSEMSFSRSQNT